MVVVLMLVSVQVEVKFPQSNHVLTITADGARDKVYVAGLSVDAHKTSLPVLKHSDLLKAHSLHFTMSDLPQTWGANQL